MCDCGYLKKDGNKCGNKVEKGEVLCKKHGGRSKKSQSGGFVFELLYPAGASVGAATYTLYKLNNIVSDWYMNKHYNKRKNKSRKNK